MDQAGIDFGFNLGLSDEAGLRSWKKKAEA